MEMDLESREKSLISNAHSMRMAIDAIQQPRSDFALEHFVVNQHDTLGHRWSQAVLEFQIKAFNAERIAIDMRLKMLEIQDLVAKHVRGRAAEKRDLQIHKLQLDVAETNLVRLGNVREAETLFGIIRELEEKHGGPWTRQQLETEEPVYWAKRLARQAMLDLKASGGVGIGNMDAIRQATTALVEEFAPAIDAAALSAMTVGLQEKQPGIVAVDRARLAQLEAASRRLDSVEWAIRNRNDPAGARIIHEIREAAEPVPQVEAKTEAG
jgi:hypothetical protein